MPVPILTHAGREDAMAPEWAVRQAGKVIGDRASTATLDGSHISLYRNPELIPVMCAFLSNYFQI